MTTGTATIHPTGDWAVYGSTPGTVGAGYVQSTRSGSFVGYIYSPLETPSGIPVGATITNVTLTITGETNASGVPLGWFSAQSDVGTGIDPDVLGGFGGVLDGAATPATLGSSATELTYDFLSLRDASFTSIPDFDAWVAALGGGDPLCITVAGQSISGSGDYVRYLDGSSEWFLTIYWESPGLPCDTWVDLDLSTSVFSSPAGSPFGQYVDGVITGLDGVDAQFWFPFELEALRRDRVEITFDPGSAHDGDGDPLTSDRFVLLYDTTPGDEDFASGVQIADGFHNTDDVVTLTIGPGLSNWDDPDGGVAQGYTRLLFNTSASGAISAIRVKKLCTFSAPPLRVFPRADGRGASSARRVFPVPGTVQASNRRGPSAIL